MKIVPFTLVSTKFQSFFEKSKFTLGEQTFESEIFLQMIIATAYLNELHASYYY